MLKILSLFELFQVIRIVPYSAVQLFAYETYKVCDLRSSYSGFHFTSFRTRLITVHIYVFFFLSKIQKLFRGEDGQLSVLGRLGAGACAGMTSTLVTSFVYLLRLASAQNLKYI